MIEKTKYLEKLNISNLSGMDESTRQTLLRTACSIIASNKNDSIAKISFADNGGNTDVGSMVIQSLANSTLSKLTYLDLSQNKAWFTSEDNVRTLCDFLYK